MSILIILAQHCKNPLVRSILTNLDHTNIQDIRVKQFYLDSIVKPHIKKQH